MRGRSTRSVDFPEANREHVIKEDLFSDAMRKRFRPQMPVRRLADSRTLSRFLIANLPLAETAGIHTDTFSEAAYVRILSLQTNTICASAWLAFLFRQDCVGTEPW